MTPEQRALYIAGAKERVAKMDPKKREELQPVADWMAARIAEVKNENR